MNIQKIQEKIKERIQYAESCIEERGDNLDKILKNETTSEFDAGYIKGLETSLEIIDNPEIVL